MKKILLYILICAFSFFQSYAQIALDAEKDSFAGKTVVRKSGNTNAIFVSPRLTVQDFYPNPATDQLNIDYSISITLKDAKMVILNVLGVPVLENQLLHGITRKEISVSHLPQGIYFLSLYVEGNRQFTRRLVIKR